MKLSKVVLGTVITSVVLSACGDDHKDQDAQHKRELECIDSTGDRLCRGEGELAILKAKAANEIQKPIAQNQQVQYQQDDVDQPIAQNQQVQYQQEREVEYPPVQPGEYHNYYGNPQYGSWGPDGRYHFSDPYGPQASNTNAYLIGAGLGGLATYVMLKSTFDQKYHGHWNDQTYRSTQYFDGTGRRINQNDYISRLEQSKRDNEFHKQRQRSTIKSQQNQIDMHKADVASKQSQIDLHKAELAAQQAKNAELQSKLNAARASQQVKNTVRAVPPAPVQIRTKFVAPVYNRAPTISRNNTVSKKRF